MGEAICVSAGELEIASVTVANWALSTAHHQNSRIEVPDGDRPSHPNPMEILGSGKISPWLNFSYCLSHIKIVLFRQIPTIGVLQGGPRWQNVATFLYNYK